MFPFFLQDPYFGPIRNRSNVHVLAESERSSVELPAFSTDDKMSQK